MCIIRSGVLQGCPLAALLFVLGIDPFFCKLYDIVINQGLGIVRACADDIAIVIKNLNSLSVIFPIFHVAETCAGLALKPRKCFLVPLFAACTHDTILYIHNYLNMHVPAWRDFNVAATAEYLGIWFGPAAGTRNWLL